MTNKEAIEILNSIPKETPDGYEFTDEVTQAFDLAIKALEKRPQGEWKVYGRQGEIPISDYCSNCKYEMRWYKNKYNFCPNCGADMRKGDIK